MMLVRLDPKPERDDGAVGPARPGGRRSRATGMAKINDAYSLGGLDLTARTLKNLLGTPDERFHINHADRDHFGGFRTRSTTSAASTSTSTAATTTPTRALPVGAALRGDRRAAPATRGCAGPTRWTTCASATSTTTSCAPPASRTSCAPPRTSCAPAACSSNLEPLVRIFAKATETDGDLQTSARVPPARQAPRPVGQRQAAASGPLPGRRVVAHDESFGRRRPGLGDYVTATPEQIQRAVREFCAHAARRKPLVQAQRKRAPQARQAPPT